MPITININGAEYEPVSEGVHSAVLIDIVDLGVIQTSFGPKDKVQFTWLTDEADSAGRTKYLFKRFNKSLHEKSTLRPFVEKMTGKAIGDVKTFDIEVLLGTQNQLVVQHSEGNDGKTYANIVGLLKPKERLTVPSDFQRKKDRGDAPKQQSHTAQVKASGGGRAAAAAVLAPAAPINDDDIPF